MRTWLLAHIALTAACALIVGMEFDLRAVEFFLLGTALSFVNIALLQFAWKRILAKKTIALAAIVIVLKYGITGYLIYKVARLGLYSLGWMSGGLGLFLLSSLSMASLSMKRLEEAR